MPEDHSHASTLVLPNSNIRNVTKTTSLLPKTLLPISMLPPTTTKKIPKQNIKDNTKKNAKDPITLKKMNPEKKN
jgi:hypothetical protein